MVYTMDIPYILPSAGIYMVYTIMMDIPCILNCYFLVFFHILLLWTYAMGEDKVMSTPEIFKKTYSSFKSCKHEFMVYTRYIPDIYMVYTIHIPGLIICKFCQLTKKAMYVGGNGNACTQHDISGHQRICIQKSCFTKDRIYHVYTWYIPGIYLAKITCEPS